MKPVCLITGAGGRLGQALCEEMSTRYDIIATYRRNPPIVTSQLRRRIKPGETSTSCSEQEPNVVCIQADLTKREDMRRLVEVGLARFGRIDALVNSAADTKFHGRLLDLWQCEDYPQAQLNLNSTVPFQLVSAIHHYAWKDQPKDNAGHNRSIVNVSSMSGLYVYPEAGQAYYGASKAALNMLTLYLSLELAPYSVRVNAICPGRFADRQATMIVVSGISNLLIGKGTGEVVVL